MSADNGLLLRHTAEGWDLRESCASDDDARWEELHSFGVFPTAEDALRASLDIWTGYGVSFAPDTPEEDS